MPRASSKKLGTFLAIATLMFVEMVRGAMAHERQRNTGETDAGTCPPRVALVFPPNVETNLGSYFPSTAVLAGYLRETACIATSQHDLNIDFADWLAQPSTLQWLDAAGPTEVIRDLAEALACVRDDLYVHDRFAFNRGGAASLLRELAAELHIEASLSTLGEQLASDVGAIYERHLDERPLALPPSVQLVGISVPMGPQLGPALILARHIRHHRPEVRIVFGGPTVSLLGISSVEWLLENHTELDAVVRFDGEFPLAELSRQAMAGQWDAHQVPGVTARDRAGRPVTCPSAAGPKLDDLPFAHFDRAILGALHEPSLDIVQARGCYWGKCTYCDFVELYGGSRPYRTRTVRRFLDELEHQHRLHGVRHFGIITESIPPAFARKLGEGIQERQLPVTWSSFIMVDRRFTPEVFAAMSEGGCRSLLIGFETMNDRVLRLVQKSASSEDNIAFLRAGHRSGISLNANLIPNLPSTTHSEALEALDALESLKPFLGELSVYPFEATRSSNVGREPARFGLIKVRRKDVPRNGQAQFAENTLDYVDPAMSPQECLEVLAAYRRFAAEHNTANPERSTPSFPFRTTVNQPNGTTDRWRVDHRSVFRLRRNTLVRGQRDEALLVVDGTWNTLLEKLQRADGVARRELETAGYGRDDVSHALEELARAGVLQRVNPPPISAEQSARR